MDSFPHNEPEISLGYAVACFGLLVGIAVICRYTRGRSGPLSGAVFVIFGPLLGVALLVAKAIRIELSSEAVRDAANAELNEFSIVAYVGMMATCGLSVSLLASILFMHAIRDELDDW